MNLAIHIVKTRAIIERKGISNASARYYDYSGSSTKAVYKKYV